MNIHELPTLRIDLKDSYIVETVCKQLDDITLNFEIYNNYVPINLSGFNVELRALKQDNVPLLQDTNIIIANNTLKIKCDKQLTTTSGIVKCELLFIEKTTKEKKFSFDIEINVIKSVLEINRSISIPTCTLLEQLEKAIDEVRDINGILDEAKKVNTELKSNISTCNKIKKDIDATNTSAIKTKNELETLNTNLNNNKIDLEKLNTVSTTNKENLDVANVQASKNIEELNKLGDVTDLATKVQTNATNIDKNTKSIEEVNTQLSENTQNINKIISSENFNFLKNSDLNTITEPGNYYIGVGCTNSPGNGFLQVLNYNNGESIKHILYRLGTLNSTDANTHIRTKFNDKWSVWSLIGGNDSGWLDLPLNDTIASTIKPKYRKNGNDIILDGRSKGLSSTGGTIGTLPSGYRPYSPKLFICGTDKDGLFVRVIINMGGAITVPTANGLDANTTIYLDNIYFKID